jgi:hypothetical protein
VEIDNPRAVHERFTRRNKNHSLSASRWLVWLTAGKDASIASRLLLCRLRRYCVGLGYMLESDYPRAHAMSLNALIGLLIVPVPSLALLCAVGAV